ncbi:MAG: extracellular solute-binding protein [Lachnospiraceae bacterium]|nr:extracellular solute-binding protein [Lachnospiraceae bacterium]
MACAVCGGCGSREQEQPTTVTIWHVYGAQTDSPLNDMIDTFNATVGKEEGIQVQVTMVSNNNNIHKDILAAAAGDPGAPELPDIFVAYPKTVLAMPDESILVDYGDYFSEEELSAFVPAFLEDGTVNGRLVSLPVAKSTELLFVNKTAFDRFAKDTGAKLSDLKTWEGLYETACRYAQWTDDQTPDVPGDGKAFFVHDFHFNYFQVGVESLGEAFFDGEEPAFGPVFEQIWNPYAKAALSGGLWLQGGYATEPLRTGESIVSVASSASVLYFSNEVIHSDNTTEYVELIAMPCPVFENGSRTVMQRGAGMCTVKSTPEREEAAITFLKWLTEPRCNTEFVVQAGYMPVVQEAFDRYLPDSIESLTEQKYVELYKAYLETQAEYEFYSAPQLETYLETETAFEEHVRRQLISGRNAYQEAEGEDPMLLDRLAEENLKQFTEMMRR